MLPLFGHVLSFLVNGLSLAEKLQGCGEISTIRRIDVQVDISQECQRISNSSPVANRLAQAHRLLK